MKNKKIFLDDLSKVHDTSLAIENLDPLYSHIELIYVLSGRGSALKERIDNDSVADPEDDFERMQKAIEAAKKIRDLTQKEVPIFYNGRKKHNQHLKQALAMGYFDYPASKFIIKSIDPENTLGQAKSFGKFLPNFSFSVIAIFSSAYHLPRASRVFNPDSPAISSIQETQDQEILNPFQKTHLLMFGIDREFQRPGIAQDLSNELEAMSNYSNGENPSISRYAGDNTYLNSADVLMHWSFELQKKASTSISSERRLPEFQKQSKEESISITAGMLPFEFESEYYTNSSAHRRRILSWN